MKCLFIGGCADGQWIDVPEYLPDWMVRVQGEWDWKSNNIPIETHCYEARKWMSPDEPRYIYVKKDIPKNKVLDILLEGYRCTTSTPSNIPHRMTSSGNTSA